MWTENSPNVDELAENVKLDIVATFGLLSTKNQSAETLEQKIPE